MLVSPLLSFFKSQLLVKLPVPSRSFHGQTVIITGASSGIGLEAARYFVKLDADKVILAVRDMGKGKSAASAIAKTNPTKTVIEIWELDLARYDSVQAFASRANGLDRLDVVVENAALLTQNWALAEDNEKTITVNVISTMLLALLIVPKLRSTAERFDKDVVLTFTGSFVHWMTDFTERKSENIFEELSREDRARMSDRYNVSKLIELLLVRELSRRLSVSSGSNRIVTSIVNPGSCDFPIDPAKPEVGSRTLIKAAEGGQDTHGQYLDDCGIGLVSEWVRSEDGEATQKKLWEELCAKLAIIDPTLIVSI